MKKRINLLTKQEKYQRVEKIFFWIRVIASSSIVFLLIINLLSFFLHLNNKKEIGELNKKKTDLLKFLTENASVEAKYQVFTKKFNHFKQIIGQDVNFLPYYRLVNQSLQSATTEAVLKSIKISKDKKTTFVIGFTTFEQMINFLNTVENINFTKNFQSLSLKNFSLNREKQSNKNEYQLDFEGQFKEQL
jgi:hypothetical protein